MAIMVTGASGQVGGAVVQSLRERGIDVVATSRGPLAAVSGVRVVTADLSAPESFDDDLGDVESVFVFPNAAGIEGFLEVAAAAGVQRAVLLSSAAVLADDAATNPIAQMHRRLEIQLEESDIKETVAIRPDGFATNALRWAETIGGGDVLPLAYASATSVPVDPRDVGAVVASLLSGDYLDKEVHVTGPEVLSQRQQVEIICEVTGSEIVVEDLTGADARRQLEIEYGTAVPGLVDSIISGLEHSIQNEREVSDAVSRITGVSPRGFRDWVAEYRKAFIAAV